MASAAAFTAVASHANSIVVPPTSQLGYPAESAACYNKIAMTAGNMQYVRLGKTGAVISKIGLGLMSYASVKEGDAAWQEWVIANEKGDVFLQQALDAGINFYDTAEMYSEGRSEVWFGEALKRLLPKSRFTREDLIISSKIFPLRTMTTGSDFAGLQKGLSRKAIHAAVEGSLKRLQLDYLDVYFIHRFDPNTAVEETMRALHDLVVAGKVRYLGASAMYTWQFNKLQQAAERNGWTKFTVMQNHYNAIYREEERDMIPYCIDSGVALTPYSPLAAGILCRAKIEGDSHRATTDKIQRNRYNRSGDDEVVAAVAAIATERGIPQAQVALAWVLAKPGVTSPIIGATKPHHISDAVAAVGVTLGKEEIERIEKAYQPHAVAGFV